MAETAVGWAINKLDLLLTEEVKLVRYVHKELKDLKDELESIKSFLRDADVRFYQENADSSLKTWVKQVREVAFQIEDVIDDYMLHVARHRDQNDFVNRIPRFLKKLKARRDIASKIQDIKSSIGQIKERNDRYNFNFSTEQVGNDSHNAWQDSTRVASLFVDEAQLVGIESPKSELISKLMEGTTKNAVISVVGMGGLGKTTLVKKVYDSESINAHFDCKAWITVPQSYNMEVLLRAMMHQFLRNQMMPTMEGINEVIEKLREYLSDKRYVIVFDDVWRIDFWGHVKTVLPDNAKSNKIIITTRNEGVAPSPNESSCYHVHKLQPLSEIKGRELFWKKVFQSNGENCPSKLEELSHAIVEKCEGLPLAIVTIGGVLATKDKTVLEWKKFFDGLSSSLASDQRFSNIATILSLSYHDLPYYLKLCFLYLSTFSEDYIESERLIRKWIAEGFVKETKGKTLEDVAEEYLTELIGRSLVQAIKISVDGKVKKCTVHDLMRETIQSRSRELGFHQVSEGNFSSLQGRTRHLSIDDSVECENMDSQAHSISFSGENELPKSVVISFIRNFKLLRSLDFQGAPIDFVPKEVGNLWHLRYLSLRGTNVKTMPKSICRLRNLETLDLRHSLVADLSFEIARLLKLRHLLAYFRNYDDDLNPNAVRGVKIHGNIGCLKALQTLTTIEIGEDVSLFSLFERLTQLRDFRIRKLKRESGMALCSALEKMTCLNILNISSINEEEVLDLQSMSHPPPMLKYLFLNGPLLDNKLPNWIPKLVDLVRIELNCSRLGNAAIEACQALLNLQELTIYKGYDGKQLHFRKRSFENLKVLRLINLNGLNELTIDDEALPVIEELTIGPFPDLKELPAGIHFLRSLRKLDFMEIIAELALRAQPNEGQDYWKVEHIPLVLFWFKIKGIYHDVYKLGDPELFKRLIQQDLKSHEG